MSWIKLLIGVGFLSIAALWIAQSLTFPFPSFARASKVGPAHFPILVASLLAIFVIIWLIRELRGEAGEEDEVKGRRIWLWYAGYGGYIALTPMLGFVLATLLLVSTVVAIKTKGGWWRRLGKAALSSLLITGLEWAIFQKWLSIPLPTGLLGPWGR